MSSACRRVYSTGIDEDLEARSGESTGSNVGSTPRYVIAVAAASQDLHSLETLCSRVQNTFLHMLTSSWVLLCRSEHKQQLGDYKLLPISKQNQCRRRRRRRSVHPIFFFSFLSLSLSLSLPSLPTKGPVLRVNATTLRTFFFRAVFPVQLLFVISPKACTEKKNVPHARTIFPLLFLCCSIHKAAIAFNLRC